MPRAVTLIGNAPFRKWLGQGCARNSARGTAAAGMIARRRGGGGASVARAAVTTAAGFFAATLLLATGAPKAAHATTVGSGESQGISAEGVMQALGFINYPEFDKAYGTSTSGFAYIYNDYIAIVAGLSGSDSVTFGTTSITHNHTGMLAIGNMKGSLQYSTDDKQALVGRNEAEMYDSGGQPYGLGVWPIPGYWTYGTGFIDYDYDAYVSTDIDGTVTPVAGAANALESPGYVNGVFNALYQIQTATGTTTTTSPITNPIGTTNIYQTPGVLLEQDISLYRATAQFHWVIRNNDSVAHQVTLRFVVPIRGMRGTGNTVTPPHVGFVFLDPLKGNQPSNFTELIPGSSLPDALTFYGYREEPDSTANPPYASKFYFRNTSGNLPTDPTVPAQVIVDEGIELRPELAGTFVPPRQYTTFSVGATAALYFGPYSLPAGGTQDVYTYFGNGQPTEQIREDAVVAAEATESLGYNSAEASAANVVGNQNLVTDAATLQEAQRAFLTPRPLIVYGDVYNRKLQTPLTTVNLTNTNLALNLPTGMSFTTNPNTGTTDTASRSVGTLAGDTDSVQQWYTQADGTVYGTLTYQVTASANEISPRIVSRSITVPAEPFLPVTGAAYQMIGVPFDFDPVISNNGDPATIVNLLAPPALRDQQTIFRTYIPDPQNDAGYGGYRIVNSVQRGVGYFYKPDFTRTIFAAGVMPGAGQADPVTPTTVLNDVPSTNGLVQLSLNRGWNMISDPYVYQIPLDNVRLLPSGTNTGGLGVSSNGGQSLLDAAQSGLIDGTIWTYNPATNSYSPLDLTTATLDPWVGYFVKLNSPLIVVYAPPTQHNSVILPDASGSTPATRAAAKSLFALSRIALPAANSQEWRQQIAVVRGNGQQDLSTVIGVSRSVKPNLAQLTKPPVPANGYVYAGLMQGTAKSRYAQVLQTPVMTGTRTWDLEVQTDTDGPATLQWPNLAASLPRTVSLSLVDESTGKTYSLRSLSSLKVNLKKSEPAHFQLIASPQKSIPLSISNLRTIRGTRAIGQVGVSYQFAFTLSGDADVTATVRTLTGKTIATLGSGRSVSVGETTLPWNGRSSDGSAIAPGAYMIEVEARDADGVVVRREMPFMSLR